MSQLRIKYRAPNATAELPGRLPEIRDFLMRGSNVCEELNLLFAIADLFRLKLARKCGELRIRQESFHSRTVNEKITLPDFLQHFLLWNQVGQAKNMASFSMNISVYVFSCVVCIVCLIPFHKH